MGNGPFSQEAVVGADCPATTITGVRPEVGGGGGGGGGPLPIYFDICKRKLNNIVQMMS